jgi:hypothetical protein
MPGKLAWLLARHPPTSFGNADAFIDALMKEGSGVARVFGFPAFFAGAIGRAPPGRPPLVLADEPGRSVAEGPLFDFRRTSPLPRREVLRLHVPALRAKPKAGDTPLRMTPRPPVHRRRFFFTPTGTCANPPPGVKISFVSSDCAHLATARRLPTFRLMLVLR